MQYKFKFSRKDVQELDQNNGCTIFILLKLWKLKQNHRHIVYNNSIQLKNPSRKIGTSYSRTKCKYESYTKLQWFTQVSSHPCVQIYKLYINMHVDIVYYSTLYWGYYLGWVNLSASRMTLNEFCIHFLEGLGPVQIGFPSPNMKAKSQVLSLKKPLEYDL